MTLLFLLVLDPWPLVYADGLINGLHSYDIVRYDVQAVPGPAGLDVDCRLTLRTLRGGPLRFFLAAGVRDLRAELDGRRVPAGLGEGGFAKVLELAAGKIPGIPGLLTVSPDPPLPADREVTLRLTYRWIPADVEFAYAGADEVQTHLASFWLPTMADEFFKARILVRTARAVIASGERVEAPEGWQAFETRRPQQLACLVVGNYRVHRRTVGERTLELYLPAGVVSSPSRLLDDLEAVLAKLEEWFGPALDGSFRLVVEPRAKPSPSYCGGTFAVVHRGFLAAPRARWLAHLAHECSHAWWGHKVASPVLGKGGTWIREGLAEWSGNKVSGALLGEEWETRLFRDLFRRYFRRIDLRRRGAVLFANESTLVHATYADDPAVPYLRGALVHRRLEQRLGSERFRIALRGLVKNHAYHMLTATGFAAALGVEPDVAYYAGTTRLPDFELVDVADGRATVRCLDPTWPDGDVPCRVGKDTVIVAMRDGRGTLTWKGTPKRIEIDPERILMDPVRSNNIWKR